MLPRWLKELLAVAAVAATAGVVAPRVLVVPRLPRALARRAPSPAAPTTPRLAATAVHTAEEDAPSPETAEAPRVPEAPSLPQETPDAGTATTRAAPRPSVPPAVARGILRRNSGRWTLDLAPFATPREAFEGARLVPPDEGGGGGYVVTHGDRLGIMRAVGVRPGDVLVAVNDIPTLDADGALDAYLRLRHNTSATFRFRRGGGTYSVRMDIARPHSRATSARAREPGG